MKLAVAAALLGALWIQDKPQIGKVCPDVTLKSLDGKEIKLSDFRKSGDQEGSVVLIVFWSFKCPDGNAILPKLAEKFPEFDKAGIKLIGICSYGEPEEKIKSVVEKKEIKYPLYYDGDASAAKALNAKVATTAIVLDAEGKVAYIGGIFHGGDEGTYDGIQAALDVKAGKAVQNAEVKPKG